MVSGTLLYKIEKTPSYIFSSFSWVVVSRKSTLCTRDVHVDVVATFYPLNLGIVILAAKFTDRRLIRKTLGQCITSLKYRNINLNLKIKFSCKMVEWNHLINCETPCNLLFSHEMLNPSLVKSVPLNV